MGKSTAKPKPNPKDLRPVPGAGGAHSKPIYNAGDYRQGWGSETPAGKGGKGGKKGKIFHYSHRLAPGATKDPWGGVGR